MPEPGARRSHSAAEDVAESACGGSDGRTGAGEGRDDGPVRMCVICRRRFAKTMLARHVLTPEGILSVDPTHTSPGRGWYLCSDPDCARRFARYRPGTRHTGRRARAAGRSKGSI